jgi:peptide-methionine (R)-S-oxide reductase
MHSGECTRRQFLVVGGLAGIAGIRRLSVAGASASIAEPDVEIVEFNDAGVKIGTARVAKVVKTDDDWRRQLSPLAFHVARERGTEIPFTGEYWNLHEKGIFRCVCCGTALFNSAAKFDSGTGWPSFWQPIAEQNVKHGSASHGYTDSEVTCRRCDAHLGDLFDDGPKPTGLRYCIDSVSLRFAKAP